MSNAYPHSAQPKPNTDDQMRSATASMSDMAEKVGYQAEEATDSLTRGAKEVVSSIDDKLRTVGVDTDKLTDLIADEILDRPIRALAVAAAVGFFVGVMAAR